MSYVIGGRKVVGIAPLASDEKAEFGLEDEPGVVQALVLDDDSLIVPMRDGEWNSFGQLAILTPDGKTFSV